MLICNICTEKDAAEHYKTPTKIVVYKLNLHHLQKSICHTHQACLNMIIGNNIRFNYLIILNTSKLIKLRYFSLAVVAFFAL